MGAGLRCQETPTPRPKTPVRGDVIDADHSLVLILRRRWRRFWFAPATPTNLGVCRALFFGGLFLAYASRDFADWADVSEVFWKPIWFFRILGLPVLPHGALLAVQAVWKISLVASAIGLLTRWSTVVATGAGIYLLGMQHGFGKIHHADAALVFTMAILALSRCGDGWSVDGLSRAAHAPAEKGPNASGEYTWPVRMVWLVIACVFFAAGVSKLRHAGLAWITSDVFCSFLIQSNDPLGMPAGMPVTNWGLWVAGEPWLCHTLAAASLLIELSVPLALVSRRLRIVIVPALFGLQVGITLIMGPDFTRFLLCYLFFIPWDEVGLRVKRWLSKSRGPFFLYDGACGLCQSTVAVLKRLDLLEHTTFCDALRDWPALHERFPTLQQEDCLENVHLVGARGEVRSGFEAYRTLAWWLPVSWPAAPLLYLPGVSIVGRLIYRAVAERRHRSGCRVASATDGQGGRLG